MTTMHNHEAEQIVCGAAMLNRDVVTEVGGIISAADFYTPKHQIIWQVITDLHNTGEPTDSTAVLQRLMESKELNKVGGGAYLSDLRMSVPSAANAAYYARIIAADAKRREFKQFAARLDQAADTGADIDAVLDHGKTILDAAPQPAWPTPIPLTGHKRQLPEFPVDALPDWLSEMVAAVAEFSQTPPDLAAITGLGCLSTAAARKIDVEVTPGWTESSNGYFVVAMPPASRKSFVVKTMASPIEAIQRQLIEEAAPRIREAKIEKQAAERIAETKADAAANLAVTADAQGSDEAAAEYDDAKNAATEAATAAEELIVPAKPRLLVDNATPETATTHLHNQGGRIAVLTAEGTIFDNITGHYSGKPNLELFLKAHVGDTLDITRRDREENVENPALTLVVALQPDILVDFMRVRKVRTSGLLGRLLFSIPADNRGYRKIRPAPIPASTRDAYNKNITTLVRSLLDIDATHTIAMSPAADRAIQIVHTDIEDKLKENGALRHIADWGGKLVGNTARIACLLHLAKHFTTGWNKPIDADTVNEASLIAFYFIDHALSTFDDVGTDEVTRDAGHVLDWITTQNTSRFNKRDLFRGVRSRIPRAGQLDPALGLLESHGYIKALPPAARHGPGRPPSPVFLVHPEFANQGGTTQTVTSQHIPVPAANQAQHQ
ncbi:DnaB domain protein helicase domain protein [Stackebrandtia nassauensis DSM 44728]|uniref:DnaB domain protein helicase domain protein n=2 Tax=Stackebrandtia TaxID=283810 RepID=D3Q397_STANL|nr:DnaB domain protein helicase domain protein [Stackebrandtia nassauensis DSM 44728]